jgi:sirohydrochlorin cobaltochelatase
MRGRDGHSKNAVILIGHGGVPKDCPREMVTKLKGLQGARVRTGDPPSSLERELDRKIRRWARPPGADPYQAGLEALAKRLAPMLNGTRLAVAYVEFCAPTLEEAVERLRNEGVERITVVPSMLTPGGVHSEVEITEAIEAIKTAQPGLSLRYVWPFDLERVARMFADEISGDGGSVESPPAFASKRRAVRKKGAT